MELKNSKILLNLTHSSPKRLDKHLTDNSFEIVTDTGS